MQAWLWVVSGVVVAVFRALLFTPKHGLCTIVALGAIAGWCGGALTQLATGVPYSTLPLLGATLAAVVALGVETLWARRGARIG